MIMMTHKLFLGRLFCKNILMMMIMQRHDEGDFRYLFIWIATKTNQETKSYGSIFDYDT